MNKNIYILYIYIYIKLSHFAVQQKLIQHCKSTILQQNFFEKVIDQEA